MASAIYTWKTGLYVPLDAVLRVSERISGLGVLGDDVTMFPYAALSLSDVGSGSQLPVHGGFWAISTYFLREWVPSLHTQCVVRQRGHVLRQVGCFCTCGTRILRSILSCSPFEVAALVVDNSSGMRVACFAGYGTPRAVFPSIVGWLVVQNSVHSRCFICGLP